MVTEADWDAAQAKTARLRAWSVVGGLLPLALASVAAMAVGEALSSGVARYLISAGCLMVLLGPVIVWLIRVNGREQNVTDSKVRALTHELAEALASADREAAGRDIQASRQRFESRLANALDMAEGEPEVIEVIERSFASALPDAPVELLLADNSHAHLLRMASAPTTGGHPGCGVDSPDQCPAARRAQVQRFLDSEDLDACPKLRNRAEGRLSALCVPVSIMGRTVGVIHATGPPNAPVGEDSVQDLGTLAKLAGARIGLLRVMAETQLAASTDSLTGLLNRRSFEQQVSGARRSHPVCAMAIADLDHFKELNDTYGHDTGDRALRLFASVIRGSLRSLDITARHGGEEFAIAFPSCTATEARGALDAARERFDAAATVAGLPKCTASFGVIDAAEHEDLPELLARADAALFDAKRRGRDQVVVHDAAGTALKPWPGLVQDSSASETPALATEIHRRLR
jgi:diguanylate cyclase (GGDEF)-like protein